MQDFQGNRTDCRSDASRHTTGKRVEAPFTHVAKTSLGELAAQRIFYGYKQDIGHRAHT